MFLAEFEGASDVSTAGLDQFHAWQREDHCATLDTTRAGQAGISFGDGPRIVSVGATAIRTAFGPVDFHVLPTKTPFLLSLADMDRLGLFFNNQTNEVVRDDIRVPAVRKWGHAWFHLARLHRLLRCAGHDDIDEQFTLRDDREFNFEITADVVQIGGKPVLHTPTKAPDFMRHDAGTNFAAEEFQKRKAHGPLRRAYDILQAELGESRSPDALLQMAVKAVNDTAGPDGLVPTLLVFGAYPRINHDSPPSPPMIKRAEAIRKAMAALHRAAAARQSEVLVWREADGWTGPWIVIGNNGHEITINHVNGPHHNPTTTRSRPRRVDPNAPLTPIKMMPCPVLLPEQRRRGRPKGSKNKPKTGVANLSKKEVNHYDHASDTQEINNLIAQGVFEFIRFDPVAHKAKDSLKHACGISARYPQTPSSMSSFLYGIAESGLHWFVTYYRHHPAGFGMVAMQTDDTLLLASPEFAAAEEREIQKAKLRSKPRSQLSAATPLEFNGCTLLAEKDDLIIQQKGQGQKLATIFLSSTDRAQQYAQQRARGAYIASICQPEATFDYSVAAQVQQPEAPDYKTLNKRIQWQTDNLQRGLRYVPLAFSTAKLMVFTDGSFANNKDLSSQLGFVIVLANEEQSPADFTIRGNVLHWSSTKSKRVTRSVLASEIYGMVNGFDMAIVIATTLQAIVKQLDLPPTPLIVCTDSYSLYECLVKLGTTKEKRLMIDIMALRQSYEQREMAEIPPNRALERLIETNRLTIRVEGYVQRPVTADTT
ncbi:polyprotein [Hirsutella rhossiliensis]|uniref:Polyprotein n=1 Tax=Hirsutella rhossiliensis TaxID=111463 RepID=A0A9P8N2S9_9HYPO|nr:polyprotein [Hirsutella rhossiliensis]KAH0965835.1 polyprotein [Hirsutella rhossiliensis]